MVDALLLKRPLLALCRSWVNSSWALGIWDPFLFCPFVDAISLICLDALPLHFKQVHLTHPLRPTSATRSSKRGFWDPTSRGCIFPVHDFRRISSSCLILQASQQYESSHKGNVHVHCLTEACMVGWRKDSFQVLHLVLCSFLLKLDLIKVYNKNLLWFHSICHLLWPKLNSTQYTYIPYNIQSISINTIYC